MKKAYYLILMDLFIDLAAINSTSSYFGDAILQTNQVASIVDDLFADEQMLENDNTLAYKDKIHKMTNHSLVAEFTSGSGSARFGTAR